MVCSPLGRTKETVQLVRGQFDVDLPSVTFDRRLQEISFGKLEGVLLSEMKRDHPEEFEARNRSKWDHLPSEGENYQMLIERLNAFSEQLRSLQ